MIARFAFCEIGLWSMVFYELTCTHCSPATKSPSEPTKCSSFVFFDIEATGLPHMEKRGKARITEISFISISRDDFGKVYNGLPRILPKLTILFSPEKKIGPITRRLTGLHEDMLQNQFPFDANKAKLIRGFLKQCKPPVCLVAHNGFRFDLPLLKEELLNFKDVIPKGTRCVDSMSAFRKLKELTVGELQMNTEIDPKKISGFKLEDLFFRLFGRAAKFVHRAEYDTLILIQCCLKLGQPLLIWFDENSISYENDIKPIYHKRRNQTTA